MSLLEMAIGRFPITIPQDSKAKKQKAGFFDLIQIIVKEAPPTVPEEGFSAEFRDFIAKWSVFLLFLFLSFPISCFTLAWFWFQTNSLVKDEATRQSPEQLLSHPFIVKAKSQRIDMSGWAHQILEL